MDLKLVMQDLRSTLSPGAEIIFPSDTTFGNLTARWSDYEAPQPSVVVSVVTESDIEKTVSDVCLSFPFCNPRCPT
jgi:hypothetical protein